MANLMKDTAPCRLLAGGRVTSKLVFAQLKPKPISNAASKPEAVDVSKRALLKGMTSAIVSSIILSAPLSSKADPFLKGSGARGLLADEEEALLNIRREKEGEARKQFEAARIEFEKEAAQSSAGKLCATPFGVDIVGITELLALVGAVVGGVSARIRKNELERLNEQLRKINLSLRQQARAGTVYAPGLTYAPPINNEDGDLPAASAPEAPPAATSRVASAPRKAVSTPVAIKSAVSSAAVSTQTVSNPISTMFSMEEEELTGDQIACKEALRAGKRLLKDQNGSAAMVRFEKALMLSKALQDKVQERRAMRGLAAAARLQAQYKAAIKHLERVLEISKEMNEFTGDADAYGTIADCYTDMGEFEKAAKFYDKYIERMNRDGPV